MPQNLKARSQKAPQSESGYFYDSLYSPSQPEQIIAYTVYFSREK
jgi:hypothetical protein